MNKPARILEPHQLEALGIQPTNTAFYFMLDCGRPAYVGRGRLTRTSFPGMTCEEYRGEKGRIYFRRINVCEPKNAPYTRFTGDELYADFPGGIAHAGGHVTSSPHTCFRSDVRHELTDRDRSNLREVLEYCKAEHLERIDDAFNRGNAGWNFTPSELRRHFGLSV